MGPEVQPFFPNQNLRVVAGQRHNNLSKSLAKLENKHTHYHYSQELKLWEGAD